MADPKSNARPRAFRLDDGAILSDGTQTHHDAQGRVVIEPTQHSFEDEIAEPLSAEERAIEVAQRRGMWPKGWSWGSLFWSAAGAFASLAIGIWIDGLIESFFQRSVALGWIGIALLALLVASAAALVIRELLGVFRQRFIAKLHAQFAAAHAADDRDTARRLTLELTTLYASRPDTARTRAHVVSLTHEIIDGRDLIDIAERDLVAPLDVSVRREIALAARRVSVVTAISPRAIVDLLFVAAQAIRLIRRISETYGARPGFIGFLRLARSVGAHLAITGGMAVGDSIVQQALGHGIAARLSARLGEGVLNGMLTARVGLSAMAVCRPMPFAAEASPRIRDVAPFLFSDGKEKD
jgi:putative membrane protein